MNYIFDHINTFPANKNNFRLVYFLVEVQNKKI